MTNYLGKVFESGLRPVSGEDLNQLVTAINAIASLNEIVSTSLNTVGAGTILASSILSGLVTRGGTQIAGFTDTTDTAANIIASNKAVLKRINSSFEFEYINNTVWPATITGGTGVTIAAVIPANSWAKFLVTYTAAATIVITTIEKGYFAVTGTFVATGASAVVVANTALTANSVVSFGINAIGGTPAGAPYLSAVTPQTGFSVKAAAGDTSTYNYEIRG